MIRMMMERVRGRGGGGRGVGGNGFGRWSGCEGGLRGGKRVS